MASLPAVVARCSKCEGCAIHHRAICRGADPTAIAELGRISHIQTFKRGDVIQAQGEPSELVGNVLSGVVKIVMASADGNQSIVGLLFASDFFGRVFLDVSRFSYEAATDVTLCCIPRLSFERFLLDHPTVEHELLVSKLDELDVMREWTYIVAAHTTMERVASFLYILLKRSKTRTCYDRTDDRLIINVPVSRRDMAAYLGTTPETLSRNIQALARDKVIRILDAKRFELLDENALIRRAGETAEDLTAIADPGG